MSTTMILRPQRQRKSPPSSVVVREVSVVKPTKSSRRRRRRARGGELISRGLPLYNQGTPVRSYIDTLNDPFSHPPVRLGWGTMVPTSLFTAYYRSTFNLNADGSGAIGLIPSLGNTNAPIQINTGAGSVSTGWSSIAFSNASTLASAMGQARIVSGGIRALPIIAATSAPGIIYAGCVPSMSQASLNSMTTSNLANLPELKTGYGALGAIATTRPVDVTSFEFTVQNVTNQSTTGVGYTSAPVIAFTNFPASAGIFIEVVLNLESILGTQSSSAALESMGEGNTNSISDYFPSVEQMWSSIKSYVSDPGIVDNMAQAAGAIGSFASQNARALGAGFRIGRHVVNAMRSTRALRDGYFGNPGPNRVIIEEVS